MQIYLLTCGKLYIVYDIYMNKIKTKSIRVSQEIHQQLRALAFKKNITIKKLIENLIAKLNK